MTLVDSSVWIDFFRGEASKAVLTPSAEGGRPWTR